MVVAIRQRTLNSDPASWNRQKGWDGQAIANAQPPNKQQMEARMQRRRDPHPSIKNSSNESLFSFISHLEFVTLPNIHPLQSRNQSLAADEMDNKEQYASDAITANILSLDQNFDQILCLAPKIGQHQFDCHKRSVITRLLSRLMPLSPVASYLKPLNLVFPRRQELYKNKFKEINSIRPFCFQIL